MFEANLADNLRALMRELKTGSFQPYPLRRHLIPKNETEFRPLGIPAVRDRVAQEVVRRLLNPIFEPLFHPSSYGFRHKRNCHMAVEAALKLHDEGFCDVVDADIKGFFGWIKRVTGLFVMPMTLSSSVRLPVRPKRHWLLCSRCSNSGSSSI
jgi:retron-type reverse transcriptase